MLLRDVVLLVHVPLERCEDIALVQQKVAAFALQLEQRFVRDTVGIGRRLTVLRRNREVFQLFSENDDRLFREQGVLRLGRTVVGRWRPAFRNEVRLVVEEARRARRPVEVLRGLSEEVQDVGEAVWIELAARVRSQYTVSRGRVRTSTP